MDLDDDFDDAGSDDDGIHALVAELEEGTQHANSENRPLKPKKVETRGRKLGTRVFKDASAAVLALNSDADEHVPALDDPSTVPGTIEYARACRSQQRQSALAALETSVAPSRPDDGASNNDLLVALAKFLASLNRSELTHLQKCMLNACDYSLRNQGQDVRSESTIMSMLHTLVLSKRGSHEIASTSSGLKKYSLECMRTACAALHMNGLLWHAMLTHATSVHEGSERNGLKGVLFIRKFRYDETPLKNRVKIWNQTLAQHEVDTSDHTKLMQVEFSIWALFQKIETGKFVVVQGKIPALLNAIDRTTAKNTLACLKNAMDVVPSFLSIAEKECNFNWRVHMSTTDRYNANILCEKLLAQQSSKWTRVNIFCDVHRLAQAQVQTMNLFQEDTSGILSVALCQRDMGALQKLREILADILVDNLEVVYESPPEQPESRAALYDLLLPVPTSLTRSQRDSKTMVRVQQRYILSSLLNGDLQSHSVTHFCEYGCCRSFDETILKFRKYCVWALLPHRCPKYAKNRWVGQDTALIWNALLMSHHHLHEKLLVKFTGVPERILSPARTTMITGFGENSDNDFMSLMDEDMLQGPKASLDPVAVLQDADLSVQAELVEEFSQAVKSAEQAFDASVAQKRAFKKKAGLWAQSQPLPRVLIMMDTIAVIRSLIFQLFHIASAKFDKVQKLKAVRGQSRTYRVLEAAEGRHVMSFFHSLCKLFSSSTAGMPRTNMNMKHRAWAFRAISRAGCATHQVLRFEHRRCPYTLFKLLTGSVAEVLDLSPCLHDELTAAYLKKYPSRAAVSSPEGRCALQTLALAIDTDISQMESRHAVVRRLTIFRSLQTWAASLEDINVRWTMKQACENTKTEMRSRQQRDNVKKVRKRGKHRHGPGGRGGGGGAWRAFLHVSYAGRKFTKDTIKQASAEHLVSSS
eukprot:s2018_g13.t1